MKLKNSLRSELCNLHKTKIKLVEESASAFLWTKYHTTPTSHHRDFCKIHFLHQMCDNQIFDNKYKIRISKNVEEQRILIRELIQTIIAQAIPNKNVMIGFSGGSMPPFLAPLLAEIDNELIPRLYLFPVDERLVPIEDGESNTGQLIRLLPDGQFPSKQILRVPDELTSGDGQTAAEEFERQLRALGPELNANGLPSFDLLLLGLGPDGHTCSLFPRHRLVTQKSSEWIAYLDDSPKPPPRRITVTMEVLNAAKRLAFIANGTGKAEVIRAIIADQNPEYPPSQIKNQFGHIEWFMDEAAASKLEKK